MKKGFTLIEVLGVIVLLGVIALIVYPAIDKTIKESREKAYLENIRNIEEVALTYSTSTDLGYSEDYKKIELQTLKKAGLLNDKDIQNPVDNSVMQGCVIYRWVTSSNQYEFKYSEECVIPE